MMNQLTKKQFLKRKTLVIANEIHASLLPLDNPPSLKDTQESFPKVSHYKDQSTGMVRVGLSLRGIRRLVKRWPLITTEAVRVWFNMDTPAVPKKSTG